MTSVFRDTWLSVVKRLKADWLILVATFITILLATTLLAAGPIYADSVFLAGAQRTLLDAPPADANIALTARIHGDEIAETDALVRSLVPDAVQPAEVDIHHTTESNSFTLLDRESEDDVTVFRFFDGIADHATLLAGSWPASGDEPFQVAIPDSTAAALDLQIGSEVRTQNRFERDDQPTVVVSGIYNVNDPNDPYWFGSPLETDGVLVGESVVTFGPFVVSEDTYVNGLTLRPSLVTWRVLPDFSQISVAQMPELRERLPALDRILNEGRDPNNQIGVETRLPAMLAEIQRSLLATRSGVYILTLQLAILAAYALVLTAGLLVDQRRSETALLRSRGGDVRQLFTLAVMEGVILTLPAILLGPWLAAMSLRILNHAGPLAGIGINLEPAVGLPAYLFAGLAGLGCVVLLSIPALLSASSVIDTRPERGRQLSQTPLQRAGVDLGLIAIAAVGFLQLRRYGAPITSSVQGRLEIDPLLVAAPAVGMLAGAVLTLRFIPQIAALADRGATRSSRLISSLSAWQIGRRSTSHARSALLLVLALGIGLFAVAFARTWEVSQSDQADFQIGADLRVQPQRYSDDNVEEGWLPAAYESLDGVQASMPYSHQSTSLPVSSGTGQVVLVDSARAAGIVRFRDDLAEDPLEDLMQRLTSRRPAVATITVPDRPQRLALDLRVDFDRLCQSISGEPLPLDFVEPETAEPTFTCLEVRGSTDPEVLPFDEPLTPAIVVRDANGSLQRITAAPLHAVDEVERVVFPLAIGVLDDRAIQPAYPLEIVAMEFTTVAAPGDARSGSFELLAIVSSNEPQGDSWTPVTFDPDPVAWETGSAILSTGPSFPPGVSSPAEGDQGSVSFTFDSGVAGVDQYLADDNITYRRNSIAVRLRPAGSEQLETLPVIISERLVLELAFEQSDTLTITVLGERYRAEVVGFLKAFPSLPNDTDAIIVADWETIVAHRLHEPGSALLSPEERWLSVEQGRSATVAEALDHQPLATNRMWVRQQRFQSLQTDPVALGTLGALSLGFVAAAIFAGIGFVTSATVSARQRLTEFALLRALGLSPRQLTGWLLVEHGFLIGVSLILGVGLGFLLALGILPLIAVNQTATGVFPEAIVTIPWLTILQLVAGILLVVVLFSALVALLLRRIGLGALLRIGED